MSSNDNERRLSRLALAVAALLTVSAGAFAQDFQMHYKVKGITAKPKPPDVTFESHTFNNCGKTGAVGPGLSNCEGAYAGAEILEPKYAFSVSSGVQQWKVPVSGTYRITAAGAAGGPGSNGSAGKGAMVRGEFHLSAGATLNVLVGQRGLASGESSGGGGGSFVWLAKSEGPLLAAGGGGGPGDSSQVGSCSVHGRNGNLSTSGSADGCNIYAGGTNGKGGATGKAGAGAGWSGDGAGGSLGGKAITGTAMGGITTIEGGFGGGGADGSGGTDSEGGGAGGGYSGGGASNGERDAAGGGGGSFIAASVQNPATSNGTWSATGNEPHSAYRGSVQSLGLWSSGHGSVTIELLK